MSKTRTFIAIEATDEVVGTALSVISSLRPHTEYVNWVAAENLHWTLQFLGDVQDELLYEICRKVSKIAADYTCFPLVADQLGAFPSMQKPRVVWLGAGEGSDLLCEMQSEIEDAMSDLGFRPDGKQFIPHLTLGRVGRQRHAGEDFIDQLAKVEEIKPSGMMAEEVIIFGSELGPEGPTYHVLGRAPLSD